MSPHTLTDYAQALKTIIYTVSKKYEARTYRLGFGSHWPRWAPCRADQLTDSSSHRSHVGGSKPERRRRKEVLSPIQKSSYSVCVCVFCVPEVWSAQPSWGRLCVHARSVSACAACPSALHGHTSSAGSAPDEPGRGRMVINTLTEAFYSTNIQYDLELTYTSLY